jgi:hypothetical protein
MTMRILKKMIVAGLALAAATAMVVVASMAQSLVPHRSTLAWIAAAAPVVAIIPAVMIGFLTACDWCLGGLRGQPQRVLEEAARVPDRVPVPRGPQRTADDGFDRRSDHDSRPARTFEEPPISLRFAKAHRRLGGKSWIGQ